MKLFSSSLVLTAFCLAGNAGARQVESLEIQLGLTQPEIPVMGIVDIEVVLKNPSGLPIPVPGHGDWIAHRLQLHFVATDEQGERTFTLNPSFEHDHGFGGKSELTLAPRESQEMWFSFHGQDIMRVERDSEVPRIISEYQSYFPVAGAVNIVAVGAVAGVEVRSNNVVLTVTAPPEADTKALESYRSLSALGAIPEPSKIPLLRDDDVAPRVRDRDRKAVAEVREFMLRFPHSQYGLHARLALIEWSLKSSRAFRWWAAHRGRESDLLQAERYLQEAQALLSDGDFSSFYRVEQLSRARLAVSRALASFEQNPPK